MMRTFLTLLALVIAAPATAATADLAATLEAPRVARLGDHYVARGTIENRGPDVVTDVRVSLYVGGFGQVVQCHSDEGVWGTLQPGEKRSLDCAADLPKAGGSGAIVYNVDSSIYVYSRSVNDPDQSNNHQSISVPLESSLPDLDVVVSSGVAKPALPHTLTVVYGNRARVPATGVRILLDAPHGFASLPSFCERMTSTRVSCSVTPPPTGETSSWTWPRFDIDVIAPDASRATFDVRAEITSKEGDNGPDTNVFTSHPKTFNTWFVTNANDEGSGSLRAALEGADAGCEPNEFCLVAFRLGAPTGGWHTIQPRTALPQLRRANLLIDGTTQPAYFGDTNPAGPEVEIDGRHAGEVNGLELFSPTYTSVIGLAINRFAGAGIVNGAVADPPTGSSWYRTLENNYLGTDPTGSTAAPNGRGIVTLPHSPTYGAAVRILGNLISGNRRAGVFAAGANHEITRNVIGLDRTLSRPIPNGASGVYVAAEASGTDVTDNHIAFNREMGVAIGAGAKWVGVVGNSLHANGLLGVDWQLDGVSAKVPFDVPEITRVWSEQGRTFVEGRIAGIGGTFQPLIRLYANDAPDPSGYGEGQYFLGAVDAERATRYPPEEVGFTFVFEGDLRGKWLAATVTQRIYTGWLRTPGITTNGDTGWGSYTMTSEFSRAVEVK